jgi:hypothetical protein
MGQLPNVWRGNASARATGHSTSGAQLPEVNGAWILEGMPRTVERVGMLAVQDIHAEEEPASASGRYVEVRASRISTPTPCIAGVARTCALLEHRA